MSRHESSNSGPMMQKCSYATLDSTYSSAMGPSARPVSGFQVVPDWGGIGYSSLVLPGPKSCSGYGTIETAYGGCDPKFSTRSCQ